MVVDDAKDLPYGAILNVFGCLVLLFRTILSNNLSNLAAPCEERPDLTTVGTEAAKFERDNSWMMLAKVKGTKRY